MFYFNVVFSSKLYFLETKYERTILNIVKEARMFCRMILMYLKIKTLGSGLM